MFAKALGRNVGVIDDGRIAHNRHDGGSGGDVDLQTRLLSLSAEAH
jgi:branched-chain amino acid transport system ATP-binding protein